MRRDIHTKYNQFMRLVEVWNIDTPEHQEVYRHGLRLAAGLKPKEDNGKAK